MELVHRENSQKLYIQLRNIFKNKRVIKKVVCRLSDTYGRRTLQDLWCEQGAGESSYFRACATGLFNETAGQGGLLYANALYQRGY